MLKKVLFSLLFVCFFVNFVNSAEQQLTVKNKSIGNHITFGNYQKTPGFKLETELLKSNSKFDFRELVPHKKVFFYTAIGLTAGSGVFLIMGIISAAISGALYYTSYYASSAHIAAIVLAGVSWGLLLGLFAPATIALWVLFFIARKNEKNSGLRSRLFYPAKDRFAICFKL